PLLVWVAQSSMQFAQQLGDPLGHCFGNLGSCGQFAGHSCLDFFDDRMLPRRLQGRSYAVSTGHSITPGVRYLTQCPRLYFRSTREAPREHHLPNPAGGYPQARGRVAPLKRALTDAGAQGVGWSCAACSPRGTNEIDDEEEGCPG